MKTLPGQVMRAVRILRKEVPKPETMPVLVGDDNYETPAFKVDGGFFCPLGLHPQSLNPFPTCVWDCGGGLADLENADITDFYEWWDKLSLKDAAEAKDLIWPIARRRTGRTRCP